MTSERAGGCQCGAVRYRFRREKFGVWACHCSECQKQSGSAFGLSMPFLKTELEVTGETASYRRPTASGSFTTCTYCPACGSRLFHISDRNPAGGVLKAGTLDDTSDLVPVAHLWTSKKQPWVVLDQGVPQFETQPADLSILRGLIR